MPYVKTDDTISDMDTLLTYAVKCKRAFVRAVVGSDGLPSALADALGLYERYVASAKFYNEVAMFHDRFFSPFIYSDAESILGENVIRDIIRWFGDIAEAYEQALPFAECVLNNIDDVKADDVSKAAGQLLEANSACERFVRNILLDSYRALDERRPDETEQQRERRLFIKQFVTYNCDEICNDIAEYRRELVKNAPQPTKRLKMMSAELWDWHI